MATDMSVKLLVDKKAGKVLFAEAAKDVVDFIFSFLALPVGTVIKLLSDDYPMPGCIDTLYTSVQELKETYIEEESKDFLLHPKIASAPRYNEQTLLIENGINSSKPSTMYVCSGSPSSHQCFTDVSGTKCHYCNYGLTRAMTYIAPSTPAAVGVATSSGEKGFVKGVVTYMIMDDLAVSPMSTISSITLLNKFKVVDLGALEEKHVKLGMKEGLAILRSSFDSETVLTDVFVG